MSKGGEGEKVWDSSSPIGHIWICDLLHPCFHLALCAPRQAMDADEGSLMSRTVALQLAERLLLKMAAQNKMEAEAEVQLYLIVLEKQVRQGKLLTSDYCLACYGLTSPSQQVTWLQCVCAEA